MRLYNVIFQEMASWKEELKFIRVVRLSVVASIFEIGNRNGSFTYEEFHSLQRLILNMNENAKTKKSVRLGG